jgi:hypothetical protein
MKNRAIQNQLKIERTPATKPGPSACKKCTPFMGRTQSEQTLPDFDNGKDWSRNGFVRRLIPREPLNAPSCSQHDFGKARRPSEFGFTN